MYDICHTYNVDIFMFFCYIFLVLLLFAVKNMNTRKRDRRIIFRLSEEENENLRTRASVCGLSICDYIRRKVLIPDDEEQFKVFEEALKKKAQNENMEVLSGHLKSLQVKLNKLAHKAEVKLEDISGVHAALTDAVQNTIESMQQYSSIEASKPNQYQATDEALLTKVVDTQVMQYTVYHTVSQIYALLLSLLKGQNLDVSWVKKAAENMETIRKAGIENLTTESEKTMLTKRQTQLKEDKRAKFLNPNQVKGK
jgi:hypothetical protein